MVATVVEVDDDVVQAKIADGRTGEIPRREFAEIPTIGAEVEVAVLQRDQPAGKVALSRAWARQHRAWESAEAARDERTLVAARVAKHVKGGLVVDLGGLRGFLPASLVDEQAVDLDELVGQEIEVAVIEADRARDRVVVSRRDALRRERRKREKEALASLQPGERMRGTIASLLDFGAQVDLEIGVRGLVHRSELSWNRFGSVSEVVEVGDSVEVVVLEVNRGKRRIGLSIRRTQDDPFADVEVGAVEQATITKVVDFGAFARLSSSGAEGLIHQSELTEQPGLRPDQVVVPGDEVLVKVIDVDAERRRIGLSVVEALLA